MQPRTSYWFGLILLSGILGLAFTCQSAPADSDARALFADSCAKCHGTDGHAKTFRGWFLGAQNFTDAKWQMTATDGEISKTIKTGIKKMPAFEKKLSATQIEALTAYVRTFKPAS